MKKFFAGGLFLLSFAVVSCVKVNPEPPQPQGKGTISIKAGTNEEVTIYNTKAVSTEPFWLTVTGPDGYTLSRTLGTELTIPNLELGEYTVSLISEKDYVLPAMNKRVFGASQTKSISGGTSTVFELVCTQLNAGIKFVLEEGVTAYYPNFKAHIEHSDNAAKSLEYTAQNAEDQDVAYFEAPSKLKIALLNGDQPIKISNKDFVELSVKTKSLYTVTIETSMEQPGSISITVTVDESVDEENPNFGIGDVLGEGTEQSPYSVSDAVNAMPAKNVWVEGYIVAPAVVTRSAPNAILIGATASSAQNKCLVLEIPASSAILSVLLEPEAVGKKIKVLGDIVGRSTVGSDSGIEGNPGFARPAITDVADFDYEGRNTAPDGTNPITPTGKVLKDIGKESIFRMGATVKTDHLIKGGGISEDYINLVKRDFNSLTLEYEMKMSIQVDLNAGAEPYRAQWLRELEGFAASNNMNVHGHALIWYKDVPTGWDELPEDIIREKVEEYIEFTMLKYPYVRSWDVVNEAINNTITSDANIYRDCIWAQAFGGGEEYVKAAFKIARRVAKENNLDCKLFYNDYKTELYTRKRDEITNMINKLNAEHAAENNGEVLIDGLGLQMHLTANTTKQSLEQSVDAALETGCLIHFSELSVSLSEEEDGSLVVTPELLAKQNDVFGYVFDLAFNKVPEDKMWGITTWGLNDSYSIYIKRQGMLFDDNFKAKRAYFSAINNFAN